MKKDNKLYVMQILDSIRKIKKYTNRVSFTTFSKDEEKQSAIIMQLILIGEIAKKLTPAYKASIKLPWKQITGFRDRAVHQYFSLDLQNLWETVKTDIPELEEKLKLSR